MQSTDHWTNQTQNKKIGISSKFQAQASGFRVIGRFSVIFNPSFLAHTGTSPWCPGQGESSIYGDICNCNFCQKYVFKRMFEKNISENLQIYLFPFWSAHPSTEQALGLQLLHLNESRAHVVHFSALRVNF